MKLGTIILSFTAIGLLAACGPANGVYKNRATNGSPVVASAPGANGSPAPYGTPTSTSTPTPTPTQPLNASSVHPTNTPTPIPTATPTQIPPTATATPVPPTPTPTPIAYYRLSTMWLGTNSDLTAWGGTALGMSGWSTSGAQAWKFIDVGGGWYRITNAALGDGWCLDIRNDGYNIYPQFAICAEASGQYWHKLATPWAGYYYLTTAWRGDGMCLDVINTVTGPSNQNQLAPCGPYTGQLWYFTPF